MYAITNSFPGCRDSSILCSMVVDMNELKSPCRGCEKAKKGCRKDCPILAKFQKDLIGETTLGGVVDTTDNGYSFYF